MRARLAHRGGGEGARREGSVGLGHRLHLAAAAPAAGAAARDAELVLAAYARWGPGCAERLVGDFAFAVWDARARTLFAARDPMGVRPLYYHCSARLVALASELKALLALH